MQKYRIISIFLLLIVFALAIGIGYITMKSSLANNRVEGFFSEQEIKDIKYKNRQSMFLFLTQFSENEPTNIYSILQQQGQTQWYTKYTNGYILPANITMYPISVDLTSVFPMPQNETDIHPFISYQIIPNEQKNNNSNITYVLSKNYYILSDATFKQFVRILNETLTYHTEDNLQLYNIETDYSGSSIYSELVEMMVIGAYVPNCLEHIYVLPYNLLVLLYPQTISNNEDFAMFVQLYSCADQLNMATNNVSDANGKRLPNTNFTTDITNDYSGEGVRVQIQQNISDFMQNTRFMFLNKTVSDNNTYVEQYVKGLEPSFIQFYVALQYFVKKYEISKELEAPENASYIAKNTENQINELNQSTRIEVQSKTAFTIFLSQFDNNSPNSGIQMLISNYGIDKGIPLTDNSYYLTDSILKQITPIQDRLDFYNNYIYNAYNFMYNTLLNLSLKNKTIKNVDAFSNMFTNGRFVYRESLENKITYDPLLLNQYIIRAYYKIITSGLSLPLDNIYVGTNPNINDIFEIPPNSDAGISDVYGRFILYYETIQEIRKIYKTDGLVGTKIGNNLITGIDTTYASDKMDAINHEANAMTLLRVLRYFVMYDMTSDIRQNGLLLDTSVPISIDQMILRINKITPGMYSFINPKDELNIKYPYPLFTQLCNDIFGFNGVEEDIHKNIITTMNLKKYSTRSEFNLHMKKIYDTFDSILFLYNIKGPTSLDDFNNPTNLDTNDQYIIPCIIILFMVSIIPFEDLYKSIVKSEGTPYLSENESIIFKNMYNAALNLQSSNIYDINKPIKLNPASSAINGANGWNTYVYGTNNAYRKNVEYDVDDDYTYNIILFNDNIKYLYYGVLYFVTNPYIVV